VCGKYKDEIDYMLNVPRSLRRNCESLHEFKVGDFILMANWKNWSNDED